MNNLEQSIKKEMHLKDVMPRTELTLPKRLKAFIGDIIPTVILAYGVLTASACLSVYDCLKEGRTTVEYIKEDGFFPCDYVGKSAKFYNGFGSFMNATGKLGIKLGCWIYDKK